MNRSVNQIGFEFGGPVNRLRKSVLVAALVRFVVPTHSGLCEPNTVTLYVQSLRLTASGLRLPVRMRPRALGQQTPPDAVTTHTRTTQNPYSFLVLGQSLV